MGTQTIKQYMHNDPTVSRVGSPVGIDDEDILFDGVFPHETMDYDFNYGIDVEDGV